MVIPVSSPRVDNNYHDSLNSRKGQATEKQKNWLYWLIELLFFQYYVVIPWRSQTVPDEILE